MHSIKWSLFNFAHRNNLSKQTSDRKKKLQYLRERFVHLQSDNFNL